MKVASRHITAADAAEPGIIRAALQSLLDELEGIEEGGLLIRLETSKQLEPIERPEVTVRGDRTYVCMCGWETSNVAELVNHLRMHGATRLVVTPENWSPKP